MKNANNNIETAKGREDSGIWNYISEKIGNAVYSAALKTPYQTRHNIVFGSNDGITGTLGINGNAKRDLHNELFARKKNARNYWSREFEAGKISRADFDTEIDNIARTIEGRYERRLEKFENEILPVAFNNFLEGVPDEWAVPEDRKYKGLVSASKVSHDASLPSGMATAMLGKAANIFIVDPPRSTPPKERFAGKNVHEIHEPGFVEKEFYKTMGMLANGFNYVGKEVYKDIDWAVGGFLNDLEWVAKQMSKHPIIVGVATITGVAGLGIAADYKHNEGKTVKKIGDYSKSAGKKISAGAAGFFGDFFKEPPVIDKIVPAANATAVATPQVSGTPAPDFLMHDGIKVIGDKQFQKDVVMTLEFAKKYSPYDSELKSTREIESFDVGDTMSAADGHTSIDKTWLHKLIEGKDIKTVISGLNHEDYHSYADLNDPKNNTEELAGKRQGKTWNNLSYVNQSEIEKFYQEFDFSKFKN